PSQVAVVGTPAYMSPEQAAGRTQHLTPATDIYSPGAILYTLLTGRGPVESAANLFVLRGRAGVGSFPPPREGNRLVWPALGGGGRKAMARVPEKRYATAKDVAADVERWLADEAVTARREPFYERLRRWARQHRVLVSSLAVLLVSMTAALAVVLAVVNS